MPTEDAYSSGHLVLSHFGTCKCSNVETNISWTCLVSGLLSFEHPSVLLFLLDIAIDPWSIWKHILSVCRSLLLAFLWQLKGTQWHIWVAIFYDMYLATEDLLGSTQGIQSSIISMCHSLYHWHNFSDFRIFFTSGLVIYIYFFKINYIYYFIGKLLGETCKSSDVCLPNNSLCLYDVCECSEDFYHTGETECLFSKYSTVTLKLQMLRYPMYNRVF